MKICLESSLLPRLSACTHFAAFIEPLRQRAQDTSNARRSSKLAPSEPAARLGHRSRSRAEDHGQRQRNLVEASPLISVKLYCFHWIVTHPLRA